MTAAQLVVAGLALWGAWDLAGRLLNWVERSSDLDDLDDHARRRRALGDVTKGQKR